MNTSGRKFPALFALSAALLLIPAAAQQAKKPLWGWGTVSQYQAATGKKLPAFKEAPTLAALVKAGKLPPVAQRLPAEPLVDNPFEAVGKYGGSMTLAQVSDTVAYPASNFTTFEPLFSLARDGKTVVPNVAKSYAYTNGGKTLTINLRRGMKWSDGNDFTADDITFMWNDVLLNKEITPTVPAMFAPGGTPMKVTKLNDYAVKLDFTVPYYSLLPNLAGVVFNGSQGNIFEASHYLKQFLPKYNKDVTANAKKAGFQTWAQLFGARRYQWYRTTPGVPTVGAWRVAQQNQQGTVYERNPYYFKVDTAGQQLPYLDRVVATNFGDTASLAVKMASGQYDYQDWGTSIADYPAFTGGAQKGNYKTWLAPSLWTSVAAYSVNQNYKGDKAVGDILRDVRFRQALSLAMNRKEINDIIAFGRGTPMQATAHPSASFYNKAWGSYMTQYDPAQANKLLDAVGMQKRDADGYRLRPDGKPFTLIISNVPDAVPAKMAELVRGDWQKVGLRTTIKDTERTLMEQQFDSGEFMVSGWAMDGASEDSLRTGANRYISGWQWAPQWTLWFNTKGKQGQKPPADVQRMFTLYAAAPSQAPEQQRETLAQAFDIWEKGLWRIGTIGLVPKPGISRTNLGNVDTNTYTDNADVGIGFYNRMYQFYRK
ncbi:peptide ABC transporter substrate-binding protein (plasmid) [Deinococcus aetherius]|uniref:Peptide ABC transporter substrate-binding protein n=1 Tax=Deinococcus aetherius TaxID=200252 RepID=A0ABN6RK44_9DEIO|nr:ABC transporter substrate-binding protein [Deinococcus aetherius]BDP43707.1 peptide ABC transporter substrate-binding protein [Deinococcus aetherius]